MLKACVKNRSLVIEQMNTNPLSLTEENVHETPPDRLQVGSWHAYSEHIFTVKPEYILFIFKEIFSDPGIVVNFSIAE